MTIKLPILVAFSLALVACTIPPSANNTNMQAPANEATMEQTIAVTEQKTAIFKTRTSDTTAPNADSETSNTAGKVGVIMDSSVTSNDDKASSVVSVSGIKPTPQFLGFEDKTDTERLAGARGDSLLIVEKKGGTVKKRAVFFSRIQESSTCKWHDRLFARKT
jgi:zinc protease